MKKERLYDLILPVWLIIYFPPILFVTLGANWIIDFVVLYSVLRLRKSATTSGLRLPSYVTKAWMIGIAADACAVIFTFFMHPGSSNSNAASVYSIYDDAQVTTIYSCAVLLAGCIIAVFNYLLARKAGMSKRDAWICALALTMGIITAPWTFLVPSTPFIHS